MEGQVGGDQTQDQPISSVQRQNPQNYRFSPEELQVLKQCNIESFYQRSLPIGSLLGVGTYFGVQSGYLRGNPRFGASPKVCIAVIAGYFIGKLSYQQKCAEKLMALPNSYIGDILRQRKRQGHDSMTLDPGFTSVVGNDPPVQEIAPQRSHLDLDSDRPYIGQYDQPLQDDTAYDVSAIPVPPGGAISTSYDELRRKNREDFELQRNRPLRTPGEPEDVPQVIRARPTPRDPSSIKPKNKYGDDIEQ